MGAEGDAGVGDFRAGEGHDLEATGVGKGGAVEAHEAGEAAGFFDEVGAGLEDEVVGVS